MAAMIKSTDCETYRALCCVSASGVGLLAFCFKVGGLVHLKIVDCDSVTLLLEVRKSSF